MLGLSSCKKDNSIDPNPVPETGNPITLKTNITEKTTLTDRIANPDLPDYIASQSIDVSQELTIQPGVVIAFERDARLTISDGGVLIAKGTADKKIKFVGVQKSKGYWNGIMLQSGSNANILEYAEVSHAASKPLYSTTKAALFVAGASKGQISLKSTVFSQNDGYGVYVYNGGLLNEFSQNAFSANSEAGIFLYADNISRLDRASAFTGGNGRDAVEVAASSEINGTAEVAWAGFTDKTPYRVLGELGVNTGWKLEPGVKLEMDRDAVIRINTHGYLLAQGTSAAKVVFTSVGNAPAFWKGIVVYSASSKNSLENTEVSNAGSVTIVSDKKANIAVYTTGAQLTVKNSVIKGSGGYGVFVGYGASANTDLKTANTFASNTKENVFME